MKTKQNALNKFQVVNLCLQVKMDGIAINVLTKKNKHHIKAQFVFYLWMGVNHKKPMLIEAPVLYAKVILFINQPTITRLCVLNNLITAKEDLQLQVKLNVFSVQTLTKDLHITIKLLVLIRFQGVCWEKHIQMGKVVNNAKK